MEEYTRYYTHATMNAIVVNTPSHFNETGIVVANAVDGVLWYYGTYETVDRAMEVAKSLNAGVVLYGGNVE